ncbi:hypothetical protein BC830DRAFT_1136123 [Chytriomyces sp. MP71]|nr:hypothetical protein BC830DRAFT_1136123 [Chytriomyces sp. MP71]
MEITQGWKGWNNMIKDLVNASTAALSLDSVPASPWLPVAPMTSPTLALLVTPPVLAVLWGLWHFALRANLVAEAMAGLKMLPTFIWLTASQMVGFRGNAVDVFLQTVRKYPNKEALVYTADNRRYTYAKLNREINKAAAWLRLQGVGGGSIVALMLDNAPEFVVLWMACLKLGAGAAFVNPHTRGASLVHVVNSAEPVCVLISNHYESVVGEVVAQLRGGVMVFIVSSDYSGEGAFERVDLGGLPEAEEPSSEWRIQTKVSDVAVLIYTSGTTGLPKPATITHARMCFASVYFSTFAGLSSADRIYCCLPLYHASGALVGWGSAFTYGCTLILAPKYSSSKFMKECKEHKATAIQYIGELARFLVNTPPSDTDREHNIRIAIGNGLRPDVWRAFKSRFGIAEVCEFYASTEGNANMVHHQVGEDGVGAVGKLGPLFQFVTQTQLVKFDPVNEVPVRDARGRCVICKPGETGELVAMISKGSLIKEFKGYYKNAEATNKKILENVFRTGDRYFRTGDLLTMDAKYNYYFVDRIGDSFRWKGENVSTFEVAEVLTSFPAIVEANVYGVHVPGAEGCAGMAAIQVEGNAQDFDAAGLSEFVTARLPKYAVPLFLRVLENGNAAHTGTFKQVKHAYRKEGINPGVVEDNMFWLRPGSKEYTSYGITDHEAIVYGSVML